MKLVTPSTFSLKHAARGIPSMEKISCFLLLREEWGFPGLAFKLLFLNQLKSLVGKACNTNVTLHMSVANE